MGTLPGAHAEQEDVGMQRLGAETRRVDGEEHLVQARSPIQRDAGQREPGAEPARRALLHPTGDEPLLGQKAAEQGRAIFVDHHGLLLAAPLGVKPERQTESGLYSARAPR